MKRLFLGAAHTAAAVAPALVPTAPTGAQTLPQYRVSRGVVGGQLDVGYTRIDIAPCAGACCSLQRSRATA